MYIHGASTFMTNWELERARKITPNQLNWI